MVELGPQLVPARMSLDFYEMRIHTMDLDQLALDAMLIWVSYEMTQVAVDLSSTILAFLPDDQRPSETGFMALEKPTPAVMSTGRVPTTPGGRLERIKTGVDLITWVVDGDDLWISAFARSESLAVQIYDNPRAPILHYHAIGQWRVSSQAPLDLSELQEPTQRRLLSLINAIWAAMMTPTLAERQVRPHPIGYHRPGLEVPEATGEVSIIHLRPLKHVNTPNLPTGASKHYTHRFYVRGHVKDQAYGPNHSLRRRIVISPYTKGPADAPLLPQVYAWDRGPELRATPPEVDDDPQGGMLDD